MRYGILLLVFAFAIAPSWAVPASEEPIKLGVLYNLTGGMSSIDQPGLKGAKLAAKLLNEKGGLLKGRKIEFIEMDTETDLGTTTRAAEDLVSRGLTAGLGYGDSDFALAAGTVFEKHSIPFVTSGATDPGLPKKVGPKMFMTAFGDDDQANAMAEFAFKTLKAKKIAIWTNKTTDFTKVLAGFFKNRFVELGGKILAEELFETDETDFQGCADRLKELSPQPDALFISAAPQDVVPTVKPLREAGAKIPILSGDGFDSDIATALGSGALATNIFFTTHAYRGDARPVAVAFADAYKKEYGNVPESAFAALAFDTVNLIAAAVKKAKSADPAAVSKALAETRGFQGVTGEISFSRPTRVPVKPVAIVSVQDGKYRLVKTWKPKK